VKDSIQNHANHNLKARPKAEALLTSEARRADAC
jgi:hypothetical protein